MLLVGRTGDGRTAACAALHRLLNSTAPNPFLSSEGAEPLSAIVDGLEIIDMPGLLSTGGLTQDEENLRKIVAKARSRPSLNALVLVVNGQCDRLDASFQVSRVQFQ